MKILYTTLPLCVLMAFGTLAVAQRARVAKTARQWRPNPVLEQVLSAQSADAPGAPGAKTTAAPERLIAVSFYDADGELYDTTRYFYSGTRGSDFSSNALPVYFQFLYTPGNAVFPYTESLFYGGTDLRIKCDSAINFDESLQEVVGIGLAYDAADRPTRFRITNYDAGELVEQYLFTYNAGGQRTVLEYSHDTAGPSPLTLLNSQYTTYAGGRAVQDSARLYAAPAFQYQRLVYSYTGSNLTTVTAYLADAAGTETVQSVYTFEYDGASRVTRALAQASGAGGVLGDVLKDSFAYSGAYSFPVYHKAWVAFSVVGSLTPIFEKRFTINSAGLRDTVKYSTGVGAADGYEYYRYNTDRNLVNYAYFDPGSTAPDDSARFYYEKYGPEAIDPTPMLLSAVVAYPNPVASALNLSWDPAAAGTSVRIHLADAAGRTLLVQTTPGLSGKAQVDMSRYALGVYTVTLLAANGTQLQSLKVTKQ